MAEHSHTKSPKQHGFGSLHDVFHHLGPFVFRSNAAIKKLLFSLHILQESRHQACPFVWWQQVSLAFPTQQRTATRLA
jgi:hypothetical protein